MTQFEKTLQQALPGLGMGPEGAVQNWLALSGSGWLKGAEGGEAPLMQGCFVADLRLPLPRGQVLLYHHSKQGAGSSFSLFAAPNGEISIFQRLGASVLRVGGVACDLDQASSLRISYRFDAAQRRWQVQLLPLGGNQVGRFAHGHGALPFAPGDLQQICLAAEKNPAVIWYGFCQRNVLPDHAAWLGPRTPIDTPQGPMAAAHLQMGDVVLTQQGPRVLRALRHVCLPARGNFAPVVLRGPFFDRRGDVLVSAAQQIAVTGYLVEYLFGCDSVRVAARDVIDGHTALAGVARDVVQAVALDIGGAALLGPPEPVQTRPGPCRMALILGRERQMSTLGLPRLTSFETAALLRQMGRVVSKVA